MKMVGGRYPFCSDNSIYIFKIRRLCSVHQLYIYQKGTYYMYLDFDIWTISTV